jgi:hypothetical protein
MQWAMIFVVVGGRVIDHIVDCIVMTDAIATAEVRT